MRTHSHDPTCFLGTNASKFEHNGSAKNATGLHAGRAGKYIT